MQRNVKSTYNIKKLDANRIDFVVCGWVAFVHDAGEVGVNPDLYAPVYTVDTADVSFAFHKETPDWIIAKFQSAFDSIRKEGTLAKIFLKYEPLLLVEE